MSLLTRIYVALLERLIHIGDDRLSRLERLEENEREMAQLRKFMIQVAKKQMELEDILIRTGQAKRV